MAYLSMQYQQQQESNWCWAACTSMVCQFYIPTQWPPQCSVATLTINNYMLSIGQTSIDCCDPTVASTAGNQTWGLLPPLALTGHFASLAWASVDPNTLINELSGGRPVCGQIAWSGGGGHFIVVNGEDSIYGIITIVYVEDPAYGPTFCTFPTLVSNYQGSGTWIGTFGTCSCVPN